MVFLSSLALALSLEPADEPCLEPQLVHALPAADADDTPIDAALFLAWDGSCGGAPLLVDVRVVDSPVAVHEALVDLWNLPFIHGEAVYEGPSMALLPDTSYEVSVTGEFDTVRWTFTTGGDTARPVDPADATLTIDAAWTQRERGSRWTEIQGTTPAGPIVRVSRNGSPLTLSTGSFALIVDGAPTEVCLVPGVRDAAGSWTDGDEVCSLVDPPRGCSTTSPALTLLPLLVVGLASRRRRHLRG